MDTFWWRENYFPMGLYIRGSPQTRYVDVMDVFDVISRTHGAAKALHSKHFGKNKIENTANTHGFLVSELKRVHWVNMKDVGRTALPLDALIKVLSVCQTPTAMKLMPDIKKFLDKATDNAVVLYNNETTNVAAMPETPAVPQQQMATETNPLTRLATSEPIPFTNPSVFRLDLVNTQPAVVNHQIEQARSHLEMNKIRADAIASANELRRAEELANASHVEKKRKIELDIGSAEALANIELKKADALVNTEIKKADTLARMRIQMEKYKWCMDNNRTDLAEKIATAITNMEHDLGE